MAPSTRTGNWIREPLTNCLMSIAYAICSVAGDLKISEVVDIPNWIVSMTVPRGIFE